MINASVLRCVLAAIATAGCLVALDAAAQKKQSDVTGTVQLNDDFSRVSPNWRTGKFSNARLGSKAAWCHAGIVVRQHTGWNWVNIFRIN